MSDLIERLRAIPVWMVGAMTPGWQEHGTAAYEAAETILSLRKEVEGLRGGGREGYAPCPTCKQYSHSLGDDALAKALMHFEAMYAHPVRGHPMGRIYDDATRDAAQVLISAGRAALATEADQ